MVDTTRKITVPNENLPAANEDFNSYFLRYRIVSEDKNLISEWSPIYQISTDKIYTASGDGGIIYSSQTKQITASWPLQENIADYDVWYKWTTFSPSIMPSNTRTISSAVLNSSNGEITYTTASYSGSSPTHTYNVGDIVTINGCSPSQYNLRDYIITRIPSRTTFVIRNNNYIGQGPFSFLSAGHVYLENWEYVGRVSGNTINFYQENPSDTNFSIRVYTPHYPISHNENYLIFAYLDRTT